MRHTLSILVENHFGELSRIVGLFSARGYNIESLTVAETLQPGVSHITLVTDGNDQTVEQILRQVDKQIRVLKVLDVSGRSPVKREMALIHVKAEVSAHLQRVLNWVCLNQLRMIDVSSGGLTIEATADPEQAQMLLASLQQLGQCDVVRTGPVALAKGMNAIEMENTQESQAE